MNELFPILGGFILSGARRRRGARLGDNGVIVKNVEYSLHKSDGKWLVSDCGPAKKT